MRKRPVEDRRGIASTNLFREPHKGRIIASCVGTASWQGPGIREHRLPGRSARASSARPPEAEAGGADASTDAEQEGLIL